MENNKLTSKSVVRAVVVTGLILLVPLLLMVFDVRVTDPGNPTPETVNWNLFDFIVMGALLLGMGFTYELLALRMPTRINKIVLAIVFAAVFFLIWAELAVGIFGTPFAGS